MGRGKKYQPEQVVNLLRQIEVAVANGKTTSQAAKEAAAVGITQPPAPATLGPGRGNRRARFHFYSPEIPSSGSGTRPVRETHSLGYSTILSKAVPRETHGGLLMIEHKHLMKSGPPKHFHLHQEEWFYVMEGDVLFEVGDSRTTLCAGESLRGPRGVGLIAACDSLMSDGLQNVSVLS